MPTTKPICSDVPETCGEEARDSPIGRRAKHLVTTPERVRFAGVPVTAADGPFGALRTTSRTSSNKQMESRYAEDGYLYIPEGISRPDVLAARREILQLYAIMGEVDDRHPLEEGISTGRSQRAGINVRAVRRALIHNGAVNKVVGAPRIARAAAAALGQRATLWNYLWPRVLAQGSGTGLHQDAPFLRGPDPRHVLSVWLPIGDISETEGGLILLSDSHEASVFRREYGDLDADMNPEFGWYSNRLAHARARHSGTWLTAKFRMGDVLIFGLHMLHGALDNTSDKLRVSIDCRWQRSDTPIDPRWMGDFPTGRHPQRIFLPSSVGMNTLNTGLRTEFHWVDDLGLPLKEKP